MKKMLFFGEALIDFLQGEQTPAGRININQYAQYPGGAPANAAVAVAKLGGKACFVGQVGDDVFGHFLRDSLQRYGVDTTYSLLHPTAKTALAFVSRDDKGERQFSFYRDQTADVIMQASQFGDDVFADTSLMHVCSNTLTTPDIAQCSFELVKRAKQAGVLISVDVNLRHNLWATLTADRQLVSDLVYLADILKFSASELDYLADGDNEAYLQQCLKHGARLILVTNDDQPIHFISAHCRGVVNAPVVKAVDTTAGGDAFIGGLLYALGRCNNMDDLCGDMSALSQLVKFAAACGAHAVTLPGAFPALPELQDVANVFPSFLTVN